MIAFFATMITVRKQRGLHMALAKTRKKIRARRLDGITGAPKVPGRHADVYFQEQLLTFKSENRNAFTEFLKTTKWENLQVSP